MPEWKFHRVGGESRGLWDRRSASNLVGPLTSVRSCLLTAARRRGGGAVSQQRGSGRRRRLRLPADRCAGLRRTSGQPATRFRRPKAASAPTVRCRSSGRTSTRPRAGPRPARSRTPGAAPRSRRSAARSPRAPGAHRRHAAGRGARRTADGRGPARAPSRRGRPRPRGCGGTPAAGGTTTSRRSPPPRRRASWRRARGRPAGRWRAGPPSSPARGTPCRRSRSRCGPARRRWPRFVGGRQDLRCARSRVP